MEKSSVISLSLLTPNHPIDEKCEPEGEQGLSDIPQGVSNEVFSVQVRTLFSGSIPAHLILDVCAWESHVTPLSPSFLLRESEGNSTTLWGCGRMKWVNICKMLKIGLAWYIVLPNDVLGIIVSSFIILFWTSCLTPSSCVCFIYLSLGFLHKDHLGKGHHD